MKSILKPLASAIILAGLLIQFFSGMAFAQNGASPPPTTVDNSIQGQNPGEGPGSTVPVVLGSWLNGVFCDDFNVPNTSTIAGWTEQSGDWQIVDGMLMTPGNSNWEYITVDGSTQADGFLTARAVYGSPTEIKFVGLVGRYTSPSNYIMAKIQDNEFSGNWNTIYVYSNGNNVYSWTNNYGTDAVIEMEYTGTAVTIRVDVDRDGTPEHTYHSVVGNTSPGLFGLAAYQHASIDDFCSGEYHDTPQTVPLSDISILISLLLGIGLVVLLTYKKI